MITRLTQMWERLLDLLKSQFGQLDTAMTPTLRLGLIGCAGLLLLYFASLIVQFNGEKYAAIQSLRRDVAFQQESLAGIDWDQRVRASQARLDEIETVFWPGNTAGLAQAGFEKWLRDEFTAHGFQVNQLQLRVNPILADSTSSEIIASDVERISAKALVAFDDRGLGAFLTAVENAPSRIVIQRMNIRGERAMRMEVDLETFRLKDGSGS